MNDLTNFECEAWINGSWAIIPVETALSYPAITVRRCLECKGPIRLHTAGPLNRPRAHAEHQKRFKGCSLGDCFDGNHRLNPDSVKAPRSDANIALVIPEEVLNPRTYREGATVTITVNRYERDPGARAACLRHFGYTCAVCLRSLSAEYGPAAKKIIHVHHLVSLRQIGEEYVVDPVKDLQPVCPNCHAVIHSRIDPYTIEDVKRMRSEAPMDATNAAGKLHPSSSIP